MQNHLYNSSRLLELYSISRATLARRLASCLIPPPLKINGRNYWSAEVIDQHLSELIGGLNHDDGSL